MKKKKKKKLFGSKTKVDILKYLLFRRQWVSMRALEWEMEWTFPAIKKQVDSLNSAWILDVNTDGNGWAITIKPAVYDMLKQIFNFAFKSDLISLFSTYESMIDKYFFGKSFWIDLEMDLVIIYKNVEKEQTLKIREEIWDIFKEYFIETWNVVFMSTEDRERRYRYADRFVLNIMRTKQF